ncbi:cytochrome C551 [Oceanobacillus arenosus]|uniref:Cytochrome C551 n=1 Tax=Oceanobacillus arenosus TaxID=1229153 RepID=A0A3D8PMR2_9BACI|nr:cytochrome c [Oceanobacillus arenosus]RDW16528.1 cytochrome C551 [Oceanobacillus arenosus]
MRKWVIATLFVTALVLGACGGGNEEPKEEATDNGTEESTEGGSVDANAGEAVFAKNCSACHGADLSGGVGPDLTQVGSRYSAEEIADIVTNGKGKMPPLNVAGEDLDNLTNWLAEKQ